MQFLSGKLDRHLAVISAAVASGVGIVGSNESVDAAVIYSGPVNSNITADTTGVYLNVVTGQQLRTGVGATDINPWFSTTSNAWLLNTTFGINVDGAMVGTAPAATAMSPGAPINASTATLAVSNATITPGTNTYGFRFRNENNGADHFGWVRLTLDNTARTGVLVDYAYESQAGVGIGAGDGVPEPASLGLLALGAVGLLRRRGN